MTIEIEPKELSKNFTKAEKDFYKSKEDGTVWLWLGWADTAGEKVKLEKVDW